MAEGDSVEQVRQGQAIPAAYSFLVLVNLVLAAWTGLAPKHASRVVFGSAELADNLIVDRAWRLAAGGFLLITGIAFALQEIAKRDQLSSPPARRLNLGLLVHEVMSLVLVPLAAPMLTREALMFGTPVFVTAASIAGYHQFKVAAPDSVQNLSQPAKMKEATMQTVKSSTHGTSPAATIYGLLALMFAGLGVANVFVPHIYLMTVFGAVGPSQAVALARTLGGAFQLPAALFNVAQKDSLESGRRSTFVKRIVDATLAATMASHTVALLPLVTDGRGWASGAGAVAATYAAAAVFYASQAAASG